MSLIPFSCLPLLPFHLPTLSFCLHFLLVSLAPSHSRNLKSWQIFLYFQRVEEMGGSWSQGLAASVVAGGQGRQQPDGEWRADSSLCPFVSQGPEEACEDQGCLASWEYSPREEMEVSFGGGCQSLQSILALSLPTLCHSAASPSDPPPSPYIVCL